MKLLAIGDIYGEAGLTFASKNLRKLRDSVQADYVIVNAENCAVGNGTDRASAELLLDSGADVLTGGNHSLQHSSFFSFLEDSDNVLRPLNFPGEAPGKGYSVLSGPQGIRILVMNAQGQVFMDYSIDNPLTATEKVLNRMKGQYDIAVCDFHAEATSEKAVFASYFDGRFAALWGTHTHVQTADERVLPGGTGFVSDLGMTGVQNSIIGARPREVMQYYATHVRNRFENATGDVVMHGALFTIDCGTAKCTSVKRIQFGKE